MILLLKIIKRARDYSWGKDWNVKSRASTLKMLQLFVVSNKNGVVNIKSNALD